MNDKRNSGLDWEDRFFKEYGRFPAGRWELEGFKIHCIHSESSFPRDPIVEIIAKGDQLSEAYEPTPQIKPKKPLPVVVVHDMDSGRMYGESIPQQMKKEKPKRTRGLNFKVQDF